MRKWLVEIRWAAHMSQYAVADAAGISQSYYASIETGIRGKPLSVTSAKKIAAVLGFDWTRFYDEDDQANAQKIRPAGRGRAVNRMRIDRVAFAAALARADLNLKRLAEKSGVSQATLTSVKSGKSCSPKTAERLATILGRDIIDERS